MSEENETGGTNGTAESQTTGTADSAATAKPKRSRPSKPGKAKASKPKASGAKPKAAKPAKAKPSGNGKAASAAPAAHGGATQKGKGSLADSGLSDSDINRVTLLAKLIGEPARIRIIAMLGGPTPRFVGELCETTGMTQPAISHHLALLRASGVVEANRQGKHIYYGLSDAGQTVYRALTSLATV